MTNGGFEDGSARAVPGWTNAVGPIDVFRNQTGALAAAEGTSMIEIDSSTGTDRVEQAVATRGSDYPLSFQHSPRPGVSNPSNKFTVYWNGTNLGTMNRNGPGLTTPSWQPAIFTVTGTGNDRISFRENDNDNLGALIDDVQLVAT